jgi:hypothetical protein
VVEHYDTLEEMKVASPQVPSVSETLFQISKYFNPFFAGLGFLIGVIVMLFVLTREEFAGLATWMKFGIAIGASTLLGYLSGKFGNAIFMLTVVLIAASIISLFGYLVWSALS